MNATFRVTVAIPTINRPEYVQRLLLSLLAGQRVPDEIVISDQSSDTRTVDLVAQFRREQPKVTWILAKPKGCGLSRNRNAAIAAATGEFIALVDDDMSVADDWLVQMIAEWVERWSSASVVITGPMLAPPGSSSPSGVANHRLSLERRVYADPPGTSEVLYGGHFGAPRFVFEQLGPVPFDTRLGVGSRFGSAEDLDFGYRILQAGIPIVYEPSVCATHWGVAPSHPRRSFFYGIGFGAVVAKHMRAGWRPVKQLVYQVLRTNFGKMLRWLFRGRLREAGVRAAAVAGIWWGFLSWNAQALLGRLPEDV